MKQWEITNITQGQLYLGQYGTSLAPGGVYFAKLKPEEPTNLLKGHRQVTIKEVNVKRSKPEPPPEATSESTSRSRSGRGKEKSSEE